MPTPVLQRLAASLIAGATLALAAPAAQAVPTVAVEGSCSVYWPGQGSQPIDVAIAGLAAGQSVRVQLEVRGTTVSGLPSLTADASGAIETQLQNWTSGLGTGPSKSAAARVVATDLSTGEEIAAHDLEVANVGVKVDSAAKAAETKRRWVVSGLSRLGGGRTYYAFYFKGRKLVGKQRLGRGEGACGYLRTNKVLIPFKRQGTFAIRIQAAKTWQGKKLPWIGGSVTSYQAYK